MQHYLECRMENKQDTFNESVSTLIQKKVRGWLSGVIEDMRRNSPVQQWLDSIPNDDVKEEEQLNVPEDFIEQNATESSVEEKSLDDHTVIEKNSGIVNDDKKLDVPSLHDLSKRKSLESGILTSSPQNNKLKKKLERDYSVQSEGYTPRLKNPLFRDSSLQSDASGSSGSSVLNVLGARKVDAESVLLALGFGPSEKQQKLQRIPDRFLVPSKLKGISTDQFIKEEQHSMRMHDCGVFGYRGLTGNPHAPPSTIVAKIMDCILQNDVLRDQATARTRHSTADFRSLRLRDT